MRRERPHRPPEDLNGLRARYGWIGFTFFFSCGGLLLVWLGLSLISQDVVSTPTPVSQSIIESLTNYSVDAALTIPIAVLVAIVGTTATLARDTDLNELSPRQRLMRTRLTLMMMAIAVVSGASLIASIFLVVSAAVNPYVAPPYSGQAAVRTAGAIFSFVVVEVVLLFELVIELIFYVSYKPFDSSGTDD